MREFLRPLLVVCLALLVPMLPFLTFGDRLDDWVASWLEPPPTPLFIAGLTVGILASDILLPVPSSLVSTLAGAQLGIVLGTAVCWVGMTAGAMLGFALSRMWGRPLAARLAKGDDLARMTRMSARYGPWIIVLTRALPVLAEAAVLLMGSTGLSWRRFLPVMMLSNLGIALAYCILGQLAESSGELPWALAASIALPVLVTALARRLISTSVGTQTTNGSLHGH